jgi:hypothetical protein
MKKVIFVFCMLVLFTACKKDKAVSSTSTKKELPSLKKDTTYRDWALIGSKIDTVIASFILRVNDAQGVTLIGSSVSFTFSGAFKPSEDLRNVYFVIKDGSTIKYTSEKKLTVADATNSFSQNAFLSLEQVKIYGVEIHADVLSTATDGSGEKIKEMLFLKLSINQTVIAKIKSCQQAVKQSHLLTLLSPQLQVFK